MRLVGVKCPKVSFFTHVHKGPGLECATSALTLPWTPWTLCVSLCILVARESSHIYHPHAGPLYRWLPVFSLFCFLILPSFIACTDAGIIQSPKHEVTEMGQAVTLRCEPILGHNLLFWYRQTFVQGLELLSYFWSRSIIDDTGMPMDRFSAERPDGSFWKIQPTEQGDSAVCVCASRLAIALQNLPLPVQKFWCFLFSPTAPSNPEQSFLPHLPHRNN